jgi:hypothetical protein
MQKRNLKNVVPGALSMRLPVSQVKQLCHPIGSTQTRRLNSLVHLLRRPLALDIDISTLLASCGIFPSGVRRVVQLGDPVPAGIPWVSHRLISLPERARLSCCIQVRRQCSAAMIQLQWSTRMSHVAMINTTECIPRQDGISLVWPSFLASTLA